MKLSDAILVWDLLRVKDVGELGFSDLIRALTRVTTIENGCLGQDRKLVAGTAAELAERSQWFLATCPHCQTAQWFAQRGPVVCGQCGVVFETPVTGEVPEPVKRTYYCETCKDQRATFENQGDIVCDHCYTIIASFKDSQPPLDVPEQVRRQCLNAVAIAHWFKNG